MKQHYHLNTKIWIFLTAVSYDTMLNKGDQNNGY